MSEVAVEIEMFPPERTPSALAGEFTTSAVYGDGFWRFRCECCGTVLSSDSKAEQGNDVGSHQRTCQAFLDQFGSGDLVPAYLHSEMPVGGMPGGRAAEP